MAKKEGIKVTEDELASEIKKAREAPGDYWKDKQKKRLTISKLIKQEVADKIPVSQDEVRNYYNSHKADFSQPTQYHARQIVVDNKELANKILARISKGEDFAALAEEFSLSPDRKHGGDLGFFNASSFPPIFSEICEKLKPGEVSEVTATDYGYQIFKLIEKRPARQRPFEEARPEIEAALKEKHLEKAFEGWFKQQRDNAKITIYEKVLEDINA